MDARHVHGAGGVAAWVLLAALGALLTAFPVAADTLRCDRGLVQVGDHMFEVLDACGQPDLWTSPSPEFLLRQPLAFHEQEWHYNRGPHQFIQILHFRDGRLFRITRGGRGFSARADTRCAARDIRVDMALLELLSRCGPPDFPLVETVRHPSLGLGLRDFTPGTTKEWVYAFGPEQINRVVTITDGRVSEVSPGQRRTLP